LPLSVVVDLELHAASRTLVAGTHGRSSFTLDLSSPTGAPVVAAGGPGVELAAPSPNPARDRTGLSFTLPRAARTELVIRDVAGRTVRTLIDGELPSGRHDQQWDGRDSAGRPVAAGVYFAVLRAAGETHTVKVTRTR
jgi:hypothetical protein